MHFVTFNFWLYLFSHKYSSFYSLSISIFKILPDFFLLAITMLKLGEYIMRTTVNTAKCQAHFITAIIRPYHKHSH